MSERAGAGGRILKYYCVGEVILNPSSRHQALSSVQRRNGASTQRLIELVAGLVVGLVTLSVTLPHKVGKEEYRGLLSLPYQTLCKRVLRFT